MLWQRQYLSWVSFKDNSSVYKCSACTMTVYDYSSLYMEVFPKYCQMRYISYILVLLMILVIWPCSPVLFVKYQNLKLLDLEGGEVWGGVGRREGGDISTGSVLIHTQVKVSKFSSLDPLLPRPSTPLCYIIYNFTKLSENEYIVKEKLAGMAMATFQCFRSWYFRNTKYLPKPISPFIRRLLFKNLFKTNCQLNTQEKWYENPRTS